jgi:WD40 repeat protein
MQTSGNGKYVAVCLVEDDPPDRDPDHPRARIGLIGAEETEIAWVATVTGRRAGVAVGIRSVLPSNDGNYVAIGEWDNKIAMVDVRAGKVAWIKPPAACYLAFSPDSKEIYGGAVDGSVRALDVQTGNELGRWYATESGASEYGQRISCVAVSPDGRWVAAGAGIEGLVFVASAATNKVVTILNHGGATVLLVHFSPDSKALATFVPGTLKIWNVTQWDKTPPSTAPAQTQPVAPQSATSESGTGRP